MKSKYIPPSEYLEKPDNKIPVEVGQTYIAADGGDYGVVITGINTLKNECTVRGFYWQTPEKVPYLLLDLAEHTLELFKLSYRYKLHNFSRTSDY